MSLLFLPLGVLVWVLCYGPVSGEPDQTAAARRDPPRDPAWTGCRRRD